MPSYIMDLRKLVGHRTLMQCAASIIIVNEKNQILLGKRTDNHKWGYAGPPILKVQCAASGSFSLNRIAAACSFCLNRSMITCSFCGVGSIHFIVQTQTDQQFTRCVVTHLLLAVVDGCSFQHDSQIAAR